jgi:P27 family predicted phage terminase small subunit
MGVRGPLPNADRRKRLGTSRTTTPTLVAVTKAPRALELPVKAPAGLGKAGKAVWAHLRQLEWVQPSDRAGILRLAQLEDERELLARAIDEQGALLTKPISTSKGDVIGNETYANPAHREIRRLDAQIADLHKAFGLTPMARARLGLAVIAVEKETTLADLRARRSRA